ncbi:hypothetical protein CTAYLR_003597 [Chrysophaeum taylorii]|uniref:Uncharacterized protein n=1 Tax=Chrysophaeum taylorii TaxID=2483200 RepID=A0AAD7XT45_9STRA|nr:hypothetical protein CTAYLR_003597 [Chrysophaeum taylorii]
MRRPFPWLIVTSAGCELGSRTPIAALDGAKQDVRAVDMDADGDVDVIVSFDGKIAWFEQPGWVRHDVGVGSVFATGDLDGDGRAEVIAAADDGVVVVYANASEYESLLNGGNASDVEVYDVDGDGDLDILVVGDDEVVIYAGPRWNVSTFVIRVPGAVAVAAYDFNGDNTAELVIAAGTTVFFYENGELEVLSEDLLDARAVDANGVAAVASTKDDTVGYAQYPFENLVRVTETAHGVRAVAAADLDGDADVDLISACFDDATVRKHSFCRDDLVFETTIVDADATGAEAVAIADINGDGVLDVVAALETHLVYYLNLDCGTASMANASKNSKSNTSASITTIVVFVIVAIFAFFAAALFLWTTRPAIRHRVELSLRRLRGDKLAAPRAPPTEDRDDGAVASTS